ncbi:MAG: hypothetical protein H6634_13720 [Anaerolineales bacterium]|nr:hypothetical protein [Anaerolineales bacterium]
MKANDYLQYRNSTFAFIDLLVKLSQEGEMVMSRGGNTKEITSVSISVSNPIERVLILPYRNNNIFATIAETLWVMSGRNDIEFLSFYLPRAFEFSDDGKVWRAGYGPRMRNWHDQVDQLAQVYELLRADPYTRRAVLSLFDPISDFLPSKDIPCNNWLNFIVRDNNLNLNIAIRSNDLFWGFSGINTFEWSFLQEALAFWLGTQIGKTSFFVGSLHYYERHFASAEKIISAREFKSVYDYGFSSPKFSTCFQDFDNELTKLFQIEELMRKGKISSNIKEFEAISDPLLEVFGQMLWVYSLYIRGESMSIITRHIENIPESDLKLAGIEFFLRKYKNLDWISLSQDEKDFLSQFVGLED